MRAAGRSIYLCHNYCEFGAVTFASVLTGPRGSFLSTHPDDVVVMIVQDATLGRRHLRRPS